MFRKLNLGTIYLTTRNNQVTICTRKFKS